MRKQVTKALRSISRSKKSYKLLKENYKKLTKLEKEALYRKQGS